MLLARDWRRMNNSTRAVWALERLYSFSLSHPASSRFSLREIYETSHREVRYFENYAFLNVNWNVSFILPCHLPQRMKGVIEIYKAQNSTSRELSSWNKLCSLKRKRKFYIIHIMLALPNITIILSLLSLLNAKIIFVLSCLKFKKFCTIHF